jgi:DedD protein
MRDTNKLKEKYELSLDSGQVVSLTVAALVVLGGVFVLGVFVGKKLTQEAAPKPAADLLTTLDEKSAALETAQKDASLTFQDELTKREPQDAVVAPKEEKKPEEKKPEHSVALAALDAGAHEPSRLAEVKPPDEVKAEPTPTRIADAGALKEAFGRVQKAPEPQGGSWALQVAAYQDKGEAERFLRGIRDRGYAPYLLESNVSGKGTWYRVRVGHFPSKDAAGKYLADFKRETRLDAFVTGN